MKKASSKVIFYYKNSIFKHNSKQALSCFRVEPGLHTNRYLYQMRKTYKSLQIPNKIKEFKAIFVYLISFFLFFWYVVHSNSAHTNMHHFFFGP
jgi:hypothetical protein